MQRLTTHHWVEAEVSLSTLQRAALLQRVLDRPESAVRVTGLSALALYNLPLGPPDPAMDRVLGHAPAPHMKSYSARSNTPHLAWAGTRRKCDRHTALLVKSYGAKRRLGPWNCALADPIEALAVAAPYLSQWRIVACLDALLSCHLITAEGRTYAPYSAAQVDNVLRLLPPTSLNTQRLRGAARDAVGRTWSPMETLARLMAVAHGAPVPQMNHRTLVDRSVWCIDLAWPEHRVGVEYNGAVHLDRKLYGNEMFRRQRLEDHGWRMRYLVWEDLTQPHRRELWLSWLRRELGRS